LLPVGEELIICRARQGKEMNPQKEYFI